MAKTIDTPADNEATIRKNLVTFREEQGWNHAEAARRLGIISASYLAKIEAGERKLPGLMVLRQVVEVYGHLIQDLWAEEPPPSDPGLMPVLAPLALVCSDEDAELIAQDVADFRRLYVEADMELRLKLKKRRQGKKR